MSDGLAISAQEIPATKGGDASATDPIPKWTESTRVARPGAGESGSRPETSEAGGHDFKLAAVDELFEAISPRDGSMGDLHTAAVLAHFSVSDVTCPYGGMLGEEDPDA
jgi:hypothetical protein